MLSKYIEMQIFNLKLRFHTKIILVLLLLHIICFIYLNLTIFQYNLLMEITKKQTTYF